MSQVKYEYVEDPPEEHFCPVNFELLLTARQTTCCGKHLSEEAAKKLESNHKSCPMCNSPNLNTLKDIHYRRQVGQTPVYCSKKSHGCPWQGAVSELSNHLKYNEVGTKDDCEFVAVSCPLACRLHITRKKLEWHMQEDCEKRPYKCNFCNEEGTHGFIINVHRPTCPKFPTKCPKNCDELLRREELPQHLAKYCLNAIVSCDFTYAGCKSSSIRRKDLKAHMENSSQMHLTLLATHGRRKDKEIEALKAQVQLLTATLARRLQSSQDVVAPDASEIGFVSPPQQVFKNFGEYASKKKKWRSSAFYSHVGGYKMCLLVLPNAQVDSAGNHYLGVFMQMLKGEFDDQLTWPFYGKVVVRLVNQVDACGSDGHIDHTLIDASSYGSSRFSMNMVARVTGTEATSCWGCVNFVPMKILEDRANDSIRYLRENSVIFQVLEVRLLKDTELS